MLRGAERPEPNRSAKVCPAKDERRGPRWVVGTVLLSSVIVAVVVCAGAVLRNECAEGASSSFVAVGREPAMPHRQWPCETQPTSRMTSSAAVLIPAAASASPTNGIPTSTREAGKGNRSRKPTSLGPAPSPPMQCIQLLRMRISGRSCQRYREARRTLTEGGMRQERMMEVNARRNRNTHRRAHHLQAPYKLAQSQAMRGRCFIFERRRSPTSLYHGMTA